ncbi:MAG: cell division protein FtsA [Kiritimatiellia bacterium]|jgi:cell division protein FtsA|nr:cell division protein FtsA [Kiritimatiellia bacterium]MDP6847843.1 cell division protein FtsA [Kiritimatiellia bacterium]
MAIPPVVALEIGTSKVIALVGEMREDNYVMITGTGECPSKGVRKGEVVDFGNVSACVKTALEMAEESSKVAIRQIYLTVSGGHIQCLSNRGTVPVLSQEEGISQDDIEQVVQVARAINIPPDRDIVHTISQHYCVDDQGHVLHPEGMEGARLSLDVLVIHGVRTRLNNTIRTVQDIPMDVSDVVFGGVCSAISVLSPEQRRSGALVIDLGGGTTDFVVYNGNVVTSAGVLGVGGDHITNDIAMAFNVSTSQAERLKKNSGSALAGKANRSQRVSLPPEVGFPGRSVNLSALHTVINARVEEMLATILHQLESEGVLSPIGGGIVLTGGGAHLKDVAELVEQVFGLPCEIGKPRGITGVATATDGPEYATCSGLVQYGFKEYQSNRRGPALKQFFKGLLGR